MISRQDLKHLQSLQSDPALSILLPTHRTSPDNKQDPIRVRNLVDEAKERLSEEFSKREIEPLHKNLDTLVEQIDYRHTLDGLALYVSHDFAQLYYLPFPVKERVIIDPTFATRDLVYGLNRAQRYWVLLLSEQVTRLIAGTGETLEEINDSQFPMEMTGPAATSPLPFDADSSYRDDRHRRYFQLVYNTFNEYDQDDSLPLIVGGVDRYLSFFNEVSQNTPAIAGTMSGNFDKLSVPELESWVTPIRQSFLATQKADALDRLETAANFQRVISTVGEVWRLAQEGRGQTLMVEKDYRIPGVINQKGHLELADDVGGGEIIDDVVDDIVEAVLAKGGDVLFLDNGTLSLYQQIALILRY